MRGIVRTGLGHQVGAEELDRGERVVELVRDDVGIIHGALEHRAGGVTPVQPRHLRQHDVRALLLGVPGEVAERVLGEHVVGADDEEVLARHGRDALVARVGRPARVRLIDETVVRVACGVLGQDLLRAVVGAVVDEDHLELRWVQALLRQHVEQLDEIGHRVVDRDHEGDERRLRGLRHQRQPFNLGGAESSRHRVPGPAPGRRPRRASAQDLVSAAPLLLTPAAAGSAPRAARRAGR